MKTPSWIGYIVFLLALLVACQPITQTQKIVLLAPFEGQYRAIGYNALYATRLALTDSRQEDIDILAIDDGGTARSLQSRYDALTQDVSVAGVILVTPFAHSVSVSSIPVFQVGQWQIESDQTSQLTDGLWLIQVSEGLSAPLDSTVVSRAKRPDADFVEAYVTSGQYVPNPNLLATYTYDITQLIIGQIEDKISAKDTSYQGRYHNFVFENEHWRGATQYEYSVDLLKTTP